jgi:signal transduction histidine kinase
VAQQGDKRCSSGDADCGSVANIVRAGRLLKWRVAAFSGLIVFVIACLVVLVISEQRRSALDGARTNAANLSAAFEEQVRLTLDNVSVAMELLNRRIQQEGPSFRLSEWAREITHLTNPTLRVSILSAEGKLVASTIDIHPAPVDLADREYFRIPRDSPDDTLFIGKPIRGRLPETITMEVARRIKTADGAFGGVLVFSLDPEFLSALHRNVDLGQEGAIVLIGKDRVVRARLTSTNGLDISAAGASLSDSPAVASSATATSGRYDGPSVRDGVPGLFHWRTVAGYPLVVVVRLGRGEVLAAADRHGQMVLIVAGLALSLPFMMMFMLNREINLRVDREIALRHEGERLHEAHGNLTAQHRAVLETTSELALERLKLTQANAELVLAKQRAEDASGAKSSFLANMSHELRTPLNAIIGFAEIIRDRILGDDPARYSECAADIQVSGVHLLRVINGVLDFAKMEAGKFVLQESVVPLDTIVSESMTAVRLQAANGGIALVDSLPKGKILLLCDETRFKQILINLLSNAVKFTPAGGAVTLAGHIQDDGALRISVADTGIGMSEQEIVSAMVPFQQVDGPLARRFAGTGLGLPLAAQLCELHDATLDVESTPAVGTVIGVRVPPARIVSGMPDAQTDDADRRIAPRAAVTQLVFITSKQEQFETRTVDLSATGARIERIGSLAQGDRVRVELGVHSAEGIVVWTDPTHIGLRFLEGRLDAKPDSGPKERGSPLHDAA